MSASKPIRVLVVDNYQVVRTGISVALRIFDDLELVGEAADGEEAVSMCARLQPDVVLMDVAMPRMDGIAATRVIRAAHPQVKIIILSGFGTEELIKTALQAGAIGYLIKDVTGTELAEAIRAASIHASSDDNGVNGDNRDNPAAYFDAAEHKGPAFTST